VGSKRTTDFFIDSNFLSLRTIERGRYVKNLPDFDGRLSPRFCEVLMQYLTAPYLRIPLVLEFFADQMRICALSSHELQGVVDSCLFEPGIWQAEYAKDIPETIPAKGIAHIGTPVGLLFNELIMYVAIFLGVISLWGTHRTAVPSLLRCRRRCTHWFNALRTGRRGESSRLLTRWPFVCWSLTRVLSNTAPSSPHYSTPIHQSNINARPAQVTMARTPVIFCTWHACLSALMDF
jgi:hypothetical protein